MIPSEPLVRPNTSLDCTVALESWLGTPAGQYILQWEQQWIDRAVFDLFGHHAVQIGMPQLDGLRECRIPNRYMLAPGAWPGKRTGVVTGSLEDWPFATQSLDLVILPHTLDISDDPHQVLREVDRVLLPEGRVVIIGLNPLSLWGLRQALWGRWFPMWPRQCNAIALPRLKDWLKLLNFESEFGKFGCYRFARTTEKGLARYGFMEKAGDRWWPYCGAAYMLCAVKRVRGMRLIGPNWKSVRKHSVGLSPAAHSQQPNAGMQGIDLP